MGEARSAAGGEIPIPGHERTSRISAHRVIAAELHGTGRAREPVPAVGGGRRRVRADAPTLRADAPLPKRSLGISLPRQLTSFVGRERELAEVVDALRAHRLVTVCGPGGAGKTRLALAAAERLRPEEPDGVFLAEFADLGDPHLVPSSVAAALGVGERPEIGVVASLGQALGQADALVVLDNCEHLLEACGALAFDLLQACPRLRLLVTSREPLGVPGEQAWRLPSLPTPTTASTAAELIRFDSVRLFVDRARSFQASFELTDMNAAAVASICELTEGIPLAIELAAGRMPTLSAEQVANQLSDALSVLASQSRLVPERQRTLRATIEWSYERLATSERLLFDRLSVFGGLASLDAVRAICSDPSLPAEEILDTLARLIDKSLVQAEAANQELTYRLLELLRQYATERLEDSGEAGVLRARHASHFAAMADQAGQDQERTRFAVWAHRLADNRHHLRAALAWSLRHDPDQALRMAGSLSWFWNTMSHLGEGRRWLELALAGSAGASMARARALRAAGQLIYRQGDAAAAQALLAEALAIYRAEGDEANMARVLRALGLAVLSLADYRLANRCLDEALEIEERLGNRVDVARTLGSLAVVAIAAGRYEMAQTRLERCVALTRENGDEWALATSIGIQGELALELGDHEAAASYLQASMSLLMRLTDEPSVAYRLEGFARLAAARAEHARALTLNAAAAALRYRLGAVAVPHWRRRLEESIARCRRLLSPEIVAEAEAEGGTMNVDEATAYAMAGANAVTGQPTGEPRVPIWASARSRAAGLTIREWDVLALLLTGLSNRVIAGRLSISPNTVNKHVGSILEKLAAHSRSQAIAIVLGLEPAP
jgi:non-specific serine/threonine protein kinase